jgi:hypothetical protein
MIELWNRKIAANRKLEAWYGPTPYLKPSPAHSLHRVGDATQGWDPVADAPFRFLLLARGMVLLPCLGLACLTPSAVSLPPPDREGRGCQTSPSGPERRAQTNPH